MKRIDPVLAGLQKIRAPFIRAQKEYGFVHDGDRILAAISGGKDSLTMLALLHELRESKAIRFELFAAHIKTDFHCAACSHQDVLTGIFKHYGVEAVFKDIKVLDEKRKTSCFWCSWNRRKALFEIAASTGCNKVAFGHHKNDIVETALLNMFFNGEISTMSPRQVMFNGTITIIRPLCFAEERVIKEVAKELQFPEQFCRCPNGAQSKRRLVKNMLAELSAAHPEADIKESVFQGLTELRGNPGAGKKH
ncbi:MAG TPA: ATP-binding protein [Candidatus Omnitrophota bacterium]|nr:ATP-binding protein [Candidatus Omnitrophota bacterium]HPT07114.1 ATP-binding protein [Candidatus Omnitrophota bacterium]